MELQISFSICTKIQKNANIRIDKKRYRININEIMRAKRNRNNRSRTMPRPYIHMLVSIPPKYSVSSIMGYLKGKNSLIIFDRHANLKYRYGNRHFWS